MSTTPATRLPSLLRSPWLAPLNDVTALNDLLGQINPVWSLTDIRARVTQVIEETPTVRSLVLKPNRRWRGFKAGQQLRVELEVDGRRLRRSYSLRTAANGQIAISIKRQGRVSTALHSLKTGDTVGLSPAEGDFVLDSPPPALLLLSAGSGATPMLSHLQALHAQGYRGDVWYVHSHRGPAEALFAAELSGLAQRWPTLKLYWHDSSRAGRLTADRLCARINDLATRHTLLCGPQGFMQDFSEYWRSQGLSGRLQTESFGVFSPVSSKTADVRCAKSERSFTARRGASLLLEAEAAGLAPAYGCRVGICQQCKCKKTSGRVRNLRDGQVSDEPDEWIQLCISSAESPVTLDL